MFEERLMGYAVGADDYMTKPFIPEELLAKTKVFLRLTATEKALKELNQSLDAKVQEKTHQLTEATAKLVNTAKFSALGEMAGGIAHEINSPLSIIALLADQIRHALEAETIDRKALIELCLSIDNTTDRITAIIRGLRAFARDGSQDFLEKVPLKQILDETLVFCQQKIAFEQVTIRLDHMTEGLILKCRKMQISQVLLNLISNACDAIAKEKERWIDISTTLKDGIVTLCVMDSGPGIPPAVRKKMFQPFFTTKYIGKGTGLGLSISQGIIESHGGTLTLDKDSPHTRFVITIPQFPLQPGKMGS